MLGGRLRGVLQGWAPYRQFVHAAHQTCLAHLLRRCRTMMLDHPYHPFAPQVQGCCRPPSLRAIAMILSSMLRTAQQRGVCTTDALATLLRASRPIVLDAFQSAPLH